MRGALLSLLLSASTGGVQAGPPGEAGPELSVTWSNVPLRAAVTRLGEAGAPAWIDRRVDPTTRLTLTATGPAPSLLAEAVAPAGLAVTAFGPLAWVGHPEDVRGLAAAQERRGLELARAPRGARRPWTRSRPVSWPRLAEPRRVVEGLAEDGGVRLTGLDRVPHDVWDAGKLPALPLADQLTLLLYGFGLEWHVTGRDAAAITPLPHGGPAAPISQAGGPAPLAPAAPPSRAAGADALSAARLTMTVRDAPAGEVVGRLASGLGLRVEFPLGAPPPGWRTRVDLVLRQATPREALELVAQKAGLQLALEPGVVVVMPARP